MDYERFRSLLKSLPTGCSSFEEVRACNQVYVDKTDYVLFLAESRQPKILTRPRRFGKSTLLSTIEELFLHGTEPYDGHDSYFKGLKIDGEWHDDGHYHVMHLDFALLNQNCENAEDFKNALSEVFSDYAQEFGVILPPNKRSFFEKFVAMCSKVPNNSLVLLIDEHDAPLIAHLGEGKEHDEMLGILKSLYSTVKSLSKKFRCVFVTGITRYKDLDLGTAGNTLWDVSQEILVSAACGYTREELKTYFHDHLVYAAATRYDLPESDVTAETVEQLLDEMSAWYDSFCFDKAAYQKVFSTWSVLRFFSNPKASFEPYWAKEEGLGLPRLLQAMLNKIDVEKALQSLSDGRIQLTDREFDKGSLVSEEVNPYIVLFETGYLTLVDSIEDTGFVYLGCPNRELKEAFANLLARKLYGEDARFTEGFSKETITVLTSLDADRLRDYFNSLLKTITYHDYPVERESMLSALISFNLMGAGIQNRSEAAESKGRADTIIDLPKAKLTLVLEYKFEKSDDPKILDMRLTEAAAQIKDRDYGNNAHSQENLARFAMVFCADPKVRSFVRCQRVD